MDKEEALAMMEHIMKTASPEYLNPGSELLGKFMVCKDYKIITICDSEDEARTAAQPHLPGVEIREPTLDDEGGIGVRVMILDAISYQGGED